MVRLHCTIDFRTLDGNPIETGSVASTVSGIRKQRTEKKERIASRACIVCLCGNVKCLSAVLAECRCTGFVDVKKEQKKEELCSFSKTERTSKTQTEDFAKLLL